ncbi:MAG: YfiR family protein [Nitrospinales bacterium]
MPLAKSRFKLLALIILMLALVMIVPSVGFPQSLEDKIKSVLIYKFSRFIKWPQGVKSTQSPIVIGVLKDDQILPILKSIISEQKDSSLTIRGLKNVDDHASVNMLIVPKELSATWRDQWDSKTIKNLFTICEGNDSPVKGCMIDFVKKNGKVAFNINLATIRNSNLGISAHLMKVANKVWE